MLKIITFIFLFTLIPFLTSVDCKKEGQKKNENDSNKGVSTVSTTNNSKSGKSEKIPDKYESIEGVVRMVGSVPFTYLVVTVDHKKDYRLPDKYKKDFSKYQTRRVRVTGIVKTEILETANRKYKITTRHIFPMSFKVIK
jgi:hypothetical protein